MKCSECLKRRSFLSCGVAGILAAASAGTSQSSEKHVMEMKPHHYIALFRDLGDGSDPARYTSGNDYLRAFNMVMESHALVIRLTMGVDFICSPCSFLKDGKCSTTIKGHGPEQPLYDWAKRIDRRMFESLGLEEGASMTSAGLAGHCRETLGDLGRVFREEAEERTVVRALSMYIGLNRYLSRESLAAGKLV